MHTEQYSLCAIGMFTVVSVNNQGKSFSGYGAVSAIAEWIFNMKYPISNSSTVAL